MIVSDFTLSDPKGVFLRSPELRIDWRPIRYLADHIDIKSATAKTLVMEKIPAFKAVPDTGEPLLPDLDIDVGRLRVDRFVFRSEERRVGKECVSTCRSRWSPYHYKKN